MIMKKLVIFMMVMIFMMSVVIVVFVIDYMFFIKVFVIFFEKKFVFIIINFKESVEISLCDGVIGVLLVLEEVDVKKIFVKVFNFDNFEIGMYYVSVKIFMQEIVQFIILNKYGVEVDFNKIRKFYVFIFKVYGNQFVDVFYFVGKFDDVVVIIFNNNGFIVYRECLDNVLFVEKCYDLKIFLWGCYIIQVEIEVNVYIREFDVW